VALIPGPRSHQVGDHGVFMPNARLRKQGVAKEPREKRRENNKQEENNKQDG